MSDDIDQERARRRASNEQTRKKGEAWVDRLKHELAGLSKGTVIVINCDTGEYVTAGSPLDAVNTFEQRFGKTAGWMHEIGVARSSSRV